MSSPVHLDFTTVDVFTSTPYAGNPLAIVRIPHGVHVSQEQKQTIAREFNLSETTFLHEKSADASQDAQDDAWTVDIFMTTRELPFAGHPTVGTACYILGRVARERGVKDGVVEGKFALKAGSVGLVYDVGKGMARAGIPHNVHIHKRKLTRDELFHVQPKLAEAQQQSKIQTKDDYPIVSIVKGMTFALVELESEEALGAAALSGRNVTNDRLDAGWTETLVGMYFYVKTGKSEDGVTRLRTRMIIGQLEDPATGSAASDLAAYLALTEGGPNKTLRYEMVQGVEMGRRSEISIDVVTKEDGSVSELYLEGGAVQVMEGRLTV
ncbi:Diaminopimelate epimerase-like protein [Dothidotthia symphoricarpi CBS 119687]|uniref:Diaminopimelate epimerase-like protein n=1 Tax=Dothidotthia symphoricarpi CBS 119687 TaxID=1392245 RepID=A0A6A6AVL9_9PLEO|nr:Diaminopimelate epimerase-like protein [Dothidotthia symphoricarpi CBS 119687]KAF2134887.1 Diaminopimelate epimerase-like protein [Dothidotthia symphoricarpi CBS 119687]